MHLQELAPYLSGILVLLVLWSLYRRLTGGASLARLVEGADGRASTSKLQFLVWTGVVLFAYSVVFAARAFQQHSLQPIDSLPTNLLIAMGLSVGTLTASKAITTAQVQSGTVAKPSAAPDGPAAARGAAAVLQDDDGCSDLTKMQLVAWSALAVVVYLVRLIGGVSFLGPDSQATRLELPDIDAPLAALMGLGHATYLGKKLITTTIPRVTGIKPASGKPPLSLTLFGDGLGENQAACGGAITIDGDAYDLSIPPDQWSDTQITFDFPATRANGAPWEPGVRHDIGLLVNNQATVRPVPFLVTVPTVYRLEPSQGRPPASVRLVGVGFGATPDGVVLTLNGVPWPIPRDQWRDDQIIIDLPDNQPDGSAWAESAAIGLQMGTWRSPTLMFKVAEA